MKALEFVTESRGLFGRRIGDTFVDDNGNEIKFQGIDIFPSDKANDAFADEKAMVKAYKKVVGMMDLFSVNERNPRARAFAVATFNYPDGSHEYWVKWFIKVPTKLMGAWQNKEVPDDGPRWTLKTASAKKAKSGLTPQDLIKTDKQAFSSVPSIVEKIAANLPEEIKVGIGQVAQGKFPATFTGQKANFEAIRDHLGEIIQPIALMSDIIKGDAEKAAKEVLHAPYSKCKVIWPQSKNTGLIDSYFVAPTGETLGVSSKGGGGAAASVNNIWAAIEKAKVNSPELLKKHSWAVSVINIIQQGDSKQGPLALGFKLKLISEEELKEIDAYLRTPTKKVRKLSPNLRTLYKSYEADINNPGYNVGYHLLSALVKQICEVINSTPKFSKACIDFLNQSSIIQIFTEAKVAQEDVQITGFRSVYPPNFQGQVLMTQKSYGASNIKGKLTFKIP
jgi:hypothetical protein